MAAFGPRIAQLGDDQDLQYVPPPGVLETAPRRDGRVQEQRHTADRLREGLADLADDEVEQAEASLETEPGDEDEDDEAEDEDDDDEDRADAEPRRRPRRRRRRRTAGRRGTQRRQRHSAAMFRGSTIDWLAILLARLGVWALLSGTFLGSAFAMHGGISAAGWLIPPFDWNAPWLPLLFLLSWPSLLGLAFQTLLTLVQWYHRHRKRSPWYLGAIVLDSVLSYLGWRDLLVPFFERLVAGLGWPQPHLLAHAIVALLALALAVIPELFLLDG